MCGLDAQKRLFLGASKGAESAKKSRFSVPRRGLCGGTIHAAGHATFNFLEPKGRGVFCNKPSLFDGYSDNGW